jgi:hypothetical protein
VNVDSYHHAPEDTLPPPAPTGFEQGLDLEDLDPLSRVIAQTSNRILEVYAITQETRDEVKLLRGEIESVSKTVSSLSGILDRLSLAMTRLESDFSQHRKVTEALCLRLIS